MTTEMTLQQAKDLAVGAHKSKQEIVLMKEINRLEAEVQRLRGAVLQVSLFSESRGNMNK